MDGGSAGNGGYEPLTRQQIDALYASIPLEKATIVCIHQYMDAATNLYGLISLEAQFNACRDNTPQRPLSLRQRSEIQKLLRKREMTPAKELA